MIKIKVYPLGILITQVLNEVTTEVLMSHQEVGELMVELNGQEQPKVGVEPFAGNKVSAVLSMDLFRGMPQSAAKYDVRKSQDRYLENASYRIEQAFPGIHIGTFRFAKDGEVPKVTVLNQYQRAVAKPTRRVEEICEEYRLSGEWLIEA